MRRVRVDSLVAWIRARTDEDNLTGLDATGWPASTWVLHAMHERRDLRSGLTCDDVRRLRLMRRDQPQTPIDDGDLDALLALQELEFEWHGRLGPEWTRLTWREQAERFGITLGHPEFSPGGHWLPAESFPANVMGPSEGSLDVDSMDWLLRCLAEHEAQGQDTACFALYAPLQSFEFDELLLFTGPLSAIPSLVDSKHGRWATPNNFWPEDHSWFVFTDYDSWATKVSGPESLIQRLRSDPDLETFDWKPAADQPRT
jgi:hypothetical protein